MGGECVLRKIETKRNVYLISEIVDNSGTANKERLLGEFDSHIIY